MGRSKSAVVRIGIALLVVAFAFTGCAVKTPIKAPPIETSPLPETTEPTPYMLQAGDTVAVAFWGNEELNEEQPIRPDGQISLPYVGQVIAAGLTPGDLEKDLVRRYTGELASPRISVIVRDFSPLRVYVGGEVGAPGVVELRGELSLLQAIQEVGGFTEQSRRRQVLVIRRDQDGLPVGRAVNVMQVVSGRAPEADIPLEAQDIVFVPRTKIANVALFIEQYVRGALPIVPGFALEVGGNN